MGTWVTTKKISLSILLIPLVSGCTTLGQIALRMENMREHCSPELNQKMRNNIATINGMQLGSNEGELLSYLGSPDHWQQVKMPENQTVNVLYYRTEHPACRGENDKFMPVVIHQRILVGKGEVFYDNNIAPYTRTARNNSRAHAFNY